MELSLEGYFKIFEELGEPEVRKLVASGDWSSTDPSKHGAALAWLKLREEAALAARDAKTLAVASEANELARDANSLAEAANCEARRANREARRANIIAAIAVAIALAAMITAITR